MGILWIIVIGFVLLACATEYCDDDGTSTGGSGVHLGSGVFSGGK